LEVLLPLAQELRPLFQEPQVQLVVQFLVSLMQYRPDLLAP
jgi:hypothetical protein